MASLLYFSLLGLFLSWWISVAALITATVTEHWDEGTDLNIYTDHLTLMWNILMNILMQYCVCSLTWIWHDFHHYLYCFQHLNNGRWGNFPGFPLKMTLFTGLLLLCEIEGQKYLKTVFLSRWTPRLITVLTHLDFGHSDFLWSLTARLMPIIVTNQKLSIITHWND